MRNGSGRGRKSLAKAQLTAWADPYQIVPFARMARTSSCEQPSQAP